MAIGTTIQGAQITFNAGVSTPGSSSSPTVISSDLQLVPNLLSPIAAQLGAGTRSYADLLPQKPHPMFGGTLVGPSNVSSGPVASASGQVGILRPKEPSDPPWALIAAGVGVAALAAIVVLKKKRR